MRVCVHPHLDTFVSLANSKRAFVSAHVTRTFGFSECFLYSILIRTVMVVVESLNRPFQLVHVLFFFSSCFLGS